MAAFLLAWNPDRFEWSDFQKNIKQVQKKGSYVGQWSCGNRRDLPKGSEIFLIRLGPEPRGIIGRGIAASSAKEGSHWDPNMRKKKLRAQYVNVRFTELSERPIIPWSDLQQLPLSRFNWSIQASGVAIPEVIVDQLNHRLTIAIAKRAAAIDFETLREYLFAEDLAEEVAILEDSTLTPTERQAVILARRGQGRFRENVLRAEPRCRVTGVADPDHLRASHIRSWKDSSNKDRISGDNGLMLAPHVDHLFDRGFISFTDVGDLLVSKGCLRSVFDAWGIQSTMNVGPFRPGQRPFLKFHREKYGFSS